MIGRALLQKLNLKRQLDDARRDRDQWRDMAVTLAARNQQLRHRAGLT